jgi:hypothetical protein
MSGPRAPHSLRHEPQSTPLKFEEPGTHGGWRRGAFVDDLPLANVTFLNGLAHWAKSGLTARRAPAQQHPCQTGIDHAVFRDTTFGGAVAADVLPLELSRCVCVSVD